VQVLALAAWLSVAALMAWLLVRCLRDGRFYTRWGDDIECAKQPAVFWINIFGLGIAVVGMFCLSVYVVLQ
jgi:hypothetical protein